MNKEYSVINEKNTRLLLVVAFIIEIAVMISLIILRHFFTETEELPDTFTLQELFLAGILYVYIIGLPALHGGIALLVSFKARKNLNLVMLYNIVTALMFSALFISFDTYFKFSHIVLPTIIYLVIVIPMLITLKFKDSLNFITPVAFLLIVARYIFNLVIFII